MVNAGYPIRDSKVWLSSWGCAKAWSSGWVEPLLCGSGRESCHLPSWPRLRCPSAEAGDPRRHRHHHGDDVTWGVSWPLEHYQALQNLPIPELGTPFPLLPPGPHFLPLPCIILPEFILLKIKSRKGRCLQANSASALESASSSRGDTQKLLSGTGKRRMIWD